MCICLCTQNKKDVYKKQASCDYSWYLFYKYFNKQTKGSYKQIKIQHARKLSATQKLLRKEAYFTLLAYVTHIQRIGTQTALASAEHKKTRLLEDSRAVEGKLGDDLRLILGVELVLDALEIVHV